MSIRIPQGSVHLLRLPGSGDDPILELLIEYVPDEVIFLIKPSLSVKVAHVPYIGQEETELFVKEYNEKNSKSIRFFDFLKSLEYLLDLSSQNKLPQLVVVVPEDLQLESLDTIKRLVGIKPQQ